MVGINVIFSKVKNQPFLKLFELKYLKQIELKCSIYILQK